MTQEAPSLAQSFAGMAAAMGAMARTRAVRAEVTHALILAILAAMLGCLAILAAEWEAGRLAPTAKPRAPSRRAATSRRTIPRPHQSPGQAHPIPTPGLRPHPAAPSVSSHPATLPRPWRPPRPHHPAHVPRPPLHILLFFETRPSPALRHAYIVPRS